MPVVGQGTKNFISEWAYHRRKWGVQWALGHGSYIWPCLFHCLGKTFPRRTLRKGFIHVGPGPFGPGSIWARAHSGLAHLGPPYILSIKREFIGQSIGYRVQSLIKEHRVQSIEYRVHKIEYTIQNIESVLYGLQSILCSLYTLQSIVYILYSTILHSILYAPSSLPYTLYYILYALYSVLYALYSMLYTLCSIVSILYIMQYSLYSILYRARSPSHSFESILCVRIAIQPPMRIIQCSFCQFCIQMASGA